MRIGRDDGAQALLARLVAAIRIRMVDFDQRLIGPLDLLRLGGTGNAQRFERPPVLFMQRLDALGRRLLGLAMAVFGEDAERIAELVAGTQALPGLARGARA